MKRPNSRLVLHAWDVVGGIRPSSQFFAAPIADAALTFARTRGQAVFGLHLHQQMRRAITEKVQKCFELL